MDADSIGYFLLLDELQTSIAANAPGKTISITAPASFWYLQYFPIVALSSVVDYIVYTTYDLYGEWDYGSAFDQPGCIEGNCLRSYNNLTETINSLSMITKAGVPSNIIAVGVSSYARSFEMTTPGCWTELCIYSGPAPVGPCTGEAVYIGDYELNMIRAEDSSVELYWDKASYSNIMVYNETNWAAYMNDTNKAAMKVYYKGLNFLGTADWAIDLAVGSDGKSAESSFGSGSIAEQTIYINPTITFPP